MTVEREHASPSPARAPTYGAAHGPVEHLALGDLAFVIRLARIRPWVNATMCSAKVERAVTATR